MEKILGYGTRFSATTSDVSDRDSVELECDFEDTSVVPLGSIENRVSNIALVMSRSSSSCRVSSPLSREVTFSAAPSKYSPIKSSPLSKSRTFSIVDERPSSPVFSVASHKHSPLRSSPLCKEVNIDLDVIAPPKMKIISFASLIEFKPKARASFPVRQFTDFSALPK